MERKPRKVKIYSLRIQKMELPRVWLEVECSKGTYIRTLCEDIGLSLGAGGCMEKLKRTRVGDFCIKDSMTLASLQAYRDLGKLQECLLPVDRVFSSYPRLTVNAAQERFLYNGNRIPDDGNSGAVKDGQIVRAYDHKGNFIALYRYEQADRSYRNEKMFFSLSDIQ